MIWYSKGTVTVILKYKLPVFILNAYKQGSKGKLVLTERSDFILNSYLYINNVNVTQYHKGNLKHNLY